MGKGRLRLGTLSTVVHDGKPSPAYMPPRALQSMPAPPPSVLDSMQLTQTPGRRGRLQYDLFDYTPEYHAWLQSPPGTMAPWVVREMNEKKRRRIKK